ncbi:hypothetical protein KIW84_076793 [Lathyrus oleraceus]|uniref:Uncharacterized protein n=1 Tax=Pisum sativum TaxID=3888 RepID=A0A9D4VYS2_PEA|nr:hypothetical protein KIW84_076793 [Pisum sativum]
MVGLDMVAFRTVAFWRSWLIFIVSIGSTNVHSPTKDILVPKGLSQWGPLSPFLFLLVAQGLVGMMAKANCIGEYQGFRVDNENHFELL